MDIIKSFIEKAQAKPLRVVYPEGLDERILKAAESVSRQSIAHPILIGSKMKIEEAAGALSLDLSGITIVERDNADTIEKYAISYSKIRGLKIEAARKMVKKPLAMAGMMVREGDADTMVAGCTCATALVLQNAAMTIGLRENVSVPSSFFIMVIPEFNGEKNSAMLFADCAVVVSPNARQLADIGVVTGRNAKKLLGIEPAIAFLSFSTKGSASNEMVDKVQEAVAIAQKRAPDLNIDGELQVDAALVAEVAAKKVADSPVAGKANVLIFPDLNAANMGYKLVHHLGGAEAIGPILQGFNKPVNDLSRGATAEDIVHVSAISVVQAQSQREF